MANRIFCWLFLYSLMMFVYLMCGAFWDLRWSCFLVNPVIRSKVSRSPPKTETRSKAYNLTKRTFLWWTPWPPFTLSCPIIIWFMSDTNCHFLVFGFGRELFITFNKVWTEIVGLCSRWILLGWTFFWIVMERFLVWNLFSQENKQ